MFIRELTIDEFEEFTNNSQYDNFHQTLDYALLKSEHGYEYEIIGFGDYEKIYIAALVLVKLIDGYLYAYIPEGFLGDYTNEKLVKDFTNALIDYYKKENIVFIKINPPIIISQIDVKKNQKYEFVTKNIINTLESAGYKKLENNNYFESALPRINPIVNLNNFEFDNLNKNTKNKIRKGIRKGLTLEFGNINQMDYLHKFTHNKIRRNEFYFDDYFNTFKRNDKIDYFLVSIDYDKYINNSNKAYEMELYNNEFLNNKLQINQTNKIINKKMNSDKALASYKNDISDASKHLRDENKTYVAAALVVRHNNMATILISGFDKEYSKFAPNYFLYFEILKYYKDKYRFVDLNGISGDFSKNSKYYGLNQFKLGFKPNVYEFIGEFDLILNEKIYHKLQKKGLLTKEFDQS